MSRLWVACVLVLGCSFEHGRLPTVIDAAAPDAAPPTATLFVADYGSSQLHRVALRADRDPMVTYTLPIGGALSPIVLPSGELLVGTTLRPALDRYLTPLATPTPNGQIAGFSIAANMGKQIMVDQRLWLMNQGGGNIVLLTFDGNGVASMAGTLPVSQGRGLVFDPQRRRVFATQCCGIDTLLQYEVDSTGSASTQTPVSGVGFDNPHGMVVTPWGELFVANANSATILRFTLDAAGNPTSNGSITGNGMVTPIDLVMTSWNELYVTNLGSNTLSRFTFDAVHTAIPGGTFAMPGNAVEQHYLAWSALVD